MMSTHIDCLCYCRTSSRRTWCRLCQYTWKSVCPNCSIRWKMTYCMLEKIANITAIGKCLAVSQHSNVTELHSITQLISRSIVKRLPQHRIHGRIMFEKANFRGHHGIIHNRRVWGQNEAGSQVQLSGWFLLSFFSPLSIPVNLYCGPSQVCNDHSHIGAFRP